MSDERDLLVRVLARRLANVRADLGEVNNDQSYVGGVTDQDMAAEEGRWGEVRRVQVATVGSQAIFEAPTVAYRVQVDP